MSDDTGFIVDETEGAEAAKQWAVLLDDADLAAIDAARDAADTAIMEHGTDSAEATDAREQLKRVTNDAKSVRINDLPFTVTVPIAKRHALIWAAVGEIPLSLSATEPQAAIDLVKAAAKQVGSDGPTVPSAHGALVKFLATVFVQVDSDLPSAYKDGLPLTDAQATT